jgi:hypothetical protein
MADRHYSRQTPGAPEFVGNGHKIVLMHFTPDGTPAAVWASHRPAPGKAVRPDGRDVWACSLFRVEHRTVHASELITEAVAITKALWGAVMPKDGFYTTINPRKAPPIRRRGRDVWGYSYLKAGWEPAGITKERKLLIFIYPPDQLAVVVPIQPEREATQLPLL